MGLSISCASESLTSKGFATVEAMDIAPLIESRSTIASFLRDEYKISEPDDEALLNHAHSLLNLDDVAANTLVIETIRHYGQQLDMAEVVYSACKPFLDAILGPDIASQTNPNIVFQYPGSQRFSELHTDAPANSEYELVAWAPLVDCYSTKSFYIVDFANTRRLLRLYREGNEFSSWGQFRDACISSSTLIEVKFGTVLFFSTMLLHGSVINETNESRWSLNTRYKSLFAPCGLKDPFAFYKVFRRSPLTYLVGGRDA